MRSEATWRSHLTGLLSRLNVASPVGAWQSLSLSTVGVNRILHCFEPYDDAMSAIFPVMTCLGVYLSHNLLASCPGGLTSYIVRYILQISCYSFQIMFRRFTMTTRLLGKKSEKFLDIVIYRAFHFAFLPLLVRPLNLMYKTFTYQQNDMGINLVIYLVHVL